jgi:hypothetical protein
MTKNTWTKPELQNIHLSVLHKSGIQVLVETNLSMQGKLFRKPFSQVIKVDINSKRTMF